MVNKNNEWIADVSRENFLVSDRTKINVFVNCSIFSQEEGGVLTKILDKGVPLVLHKPDPVLH